MTMKKKDLFTLHGAITNLANVKAVKVAYGLAKNKKIINDEIELIKESLEKIDDKYTDVEKEYETKRIELAKEYSDKDKDDNPIVVKNNYKVTTNIGLFTEKLEQLNAEYSEFIEHRTKIKENNDKLLDSESEIEFYKINLNDFPSDLSLNDISLITDLIKE
jgi:uncharacterized protein (DUF3084 family)